MAEEIEVYPALDKDIVYIDSLQKKNAEDLAFYPRVVFEREVSNYRLLLAKVNNEPAGYLYHGVLDGYVRIHQACIQYDLRGQLYGAELIRFLELLCEKASVYSVHLRCGSDIAANGFWRAMGFVCEAVTKGGIRRSRDINHWVKYLQSSLFEFSTVNPSNKKKSASVWAKGRKAGLSSNGFYRGANTKLYRQLVESTVLGEETEK